MYGLMGREQAVIIEMIGLFFEPDECVLLLWGSGKVQLPDAFSVSPFESVIVVDFKNDS